MTNLKTNLSMAKIQVTQMRDRDLEEVLAIENASFQTPWTRGMFLSELDANPFARSVVARFPGGPQIVGYACFWIVMDELHVMNLAVHPDHRRQNIGQELTRWMLSLGYDKKCRSAMLEVRESNHSARRLYEKLGFKVIGIRRGYYRDPKEDALVMLIDPLAVVSPSVSSKGGHHE
jgi:ribosomal-protein-alanine N-acetyltransferase